MSAHIQLFFSAMNPFILIFRGFCFHGKCQTNSFSKSLHLNLVRLGLEKLYYKLYKVRFLKDFPKSFFESRLYIIFNFTISMIRNLHPSPKSLLPAKQHSSHIGSDFLEQTNTFQAVLLRYQFRFWHL